MSAERAGRTAWRIAVTAISVAVCLLAPSRPAVGQSAVPADRDALIRLAEAAGMKGLPVAPLVNKVREGLAKGHDPKRIELVIGQMIQRMEAADRIAREVEPGAAAAAREGAVVLLEQALSSGITIDEIRELQRQAQVPTLTSQDLAGAARGLSFIKEARLPVTDGTGVMAEAVRQKFRSYEMLDVGREIKRREADYRAGRATLRALRDAIARGARPDALLRDSRAVVERPSVARPDATADRPERTAPVDRPERPTDRPAAPGGERTR